MDTVVLKFGGSSLANNERLMMVANKIIEKAMKHKVVVVVSAQGKTTDNLLKQAKELEEITKSQNINKRELDMLLSTGEQVSASKLAILLNLIGHKSISLNGYQAQIYTNNNYQNAFKDSLNIPCVGISSLESLAYNIDSDGIICSLIDAKNNNVYFGVFEKKNNIVTQLEELSFKTIKEIIPILKKYDKINFVGDGSIIHKEYLLSNFFFFRISTANLYSSSPKSIVGTISLLLYIFINCLIVTHLASVASPSGNVISLIEIFF